MIGDFGTILGVWAHPDDEAFLSAGIMAAAREAGQRVFVVTATRGERGTADPETWPPARLARRREIELERSLALLGVSEHLILGHPDGACADVPLEIGAAEIAGTIDAVQPDTILTFGSDGFTGHPDHRSMARWVDEAVRWTGTRARVLHATATADYLDAFDDLHRQFDVFFAGEPSITDPADLLIDLTVTGRLHEQKIAALAAQSSQTAGLITAMGLDRFGAWVAREYFAEAKPVVVA